MKKNLKTVMISIFFCLLFTGCKNTDLKSVSCISALNIINKTGALLQQSCNAVSYKSSRKNIDPHFGIDIPYNMDRGFIFDVPGNTDNGFIIDLSSDTGSKILSDDKAGSYNGTVLTGTGDSWADIFGADGWEFTTADNKYPFMKAENPEYENAVLYVYNSSKTFTSESEIIDYGTYGYSINCYSASEFPDMAWCGLTFGADADELTAVYGNPEHTYTGSIYTCYAYDVSDTVKIFFYIYHENGLKSVTVSFSGCA